MSTMPIAEPGIIDAEQLRQDFPVLQTKVNGKALIYLDSGATAQKPQVVIDAISKYYKSQNANVHRGVHHLSQLATELYDKARVSVQKHINAASPAEIIFTRGTTESINLVATVLGERTIQAGDELLITEMEHHSNIVPWQILAQRTSAVIKAIPVNSKGELDLDAAKKLIGPKTKLLAVTHISNTMGTINPVKELTAWAHEQGALVLIDGAQAVPHTKVNVADLNCDFYCFSGHKLFGPTGIGVLYGKKDLLEKLPPYQGGGGMIKTVKLQETTYADLPQKYEAGTPHIEGAIGLAAAIDYVNAIGLDKIEAYEHNLLQYATERLEQIPDLKIIGQAEQKAAVISFVVEGIHPFDLGTILDKLGIAVRTGHHCNQPLMELFQIPGTVRASFAFYNTKADVDALVDGVKKAISMLK